MYARPNEIAAVLGLANPNSVTLLHLALRAEDGLRVECLHALAEATTADKQIFLDSIFSRSTLRRRQKRGQFTARESDLLMRLAATWLIARDTFGDNGKAQRFLFTEHSSREGRRPFDLAAMNASGFHAVEQLLGRLRYGSAA